MTALQVVSEWVCHPPKTWVLGISFSGIWVMNKDDGYITDDPEEIHKILQREHNEESNE